MERLMCLNEDFGRGDPVGSGCADRWPATGRAVDAGPVMARTRCSGLAQGEGGVHEVS